MKHIKKSHKNTPVYEGHFQALLKGGGFVKRSDSEEEFYIHPDDVNLAWHNDIVKISVLPRSKNPRGNAKQAKIVEVVKRHIENVPVQFIRRSGRTLFCRPVDGRYHFTISISFARGEEIPHGLTPGHLLLAAPKKHLGHNLYDASLMEILGRENDVTVQEDMVKLAHNVPLKFPELALAEAASLPTAPTPQDMEGRKDCCEIPFVTIDGADAKDFDDAIQVSPLSNGYLLRVAIADVSFYVRPDGKEDGLDAEARRRGNSWYFPTSVEPMLPKTLSNGLCSLAPRQKRLAVMVEIPFDNDGVPGKPEFAQIVMESWARLIYENVQKFFDGSGLYIPDGEAAPREPEKIGAMLNHARELYKILANARKRRGALDFDLPDAKYEFAPDGTVIGVGIAQRNDAHRLIEEFMIAANEAVARYLGSTPWPFLYRVHPAPEEAKVMALIETLRTTAVENLPPGIMENGRPAPDAIQKILAASAGTSAEYVVNKLCLRALPQAKYSPENIGHFGLASSAYCHFTSPIRRYADLLAHRALKTSMGVPVGEIPDFDQLQEISSHLNTLERQAIDCEREMTKRMGCLLLQNHEGEAFRAVVSGVADFAIFIELQDKPLEGIIRLDELTYDWFELDSKTQRLIGQKTGQIWELGQALTARLEKADLLRLELRFLPKIDFQQRSSTPRRRKGRQHASPKKHHEGDIKNSRRPARNTRKNKNGFGEKKGKNNNHQRRGKKTR